jgi:hypothetical protein
MRFLFGKRGQAEVIGIAGTLFFSLALMVAAGMAIWNRQMKKTRMASAVEQVKSGIAESAYSAFRSAEIEYLKAASGCSTAKGFYRALVEGSGCAGVSVNLFSSSATPDSGAFYQFLGSGCTIGNTSSNCQALEGQDILRVNGGVGAKFENYDVTIALKRIAPADSIIEFAIKMSGLNNTSNTSSGFALRRSPVNMAHLEPDGRVTQELPDIQAKCPGQPWATYLVFDPSQRKCLSFAQLGSGTGLAYYGGRYFGFRSADGQVVDLLTLGTGASYLVDETGKIGTDQAFVPHERDLLTNADDITLIGDRIYFVIGLGLEARIQALDMATNDVVDICRLGTLGWSTAYVGIAATSWSQDLLDPTLPATATAMAMFFLKTDSGDFLNAIATKTSGVITCLVSKEAGQQEVEYRRTYGFDRVGDLRPYYLY